MNEINESLLSIVSDEEIKQLTIFEQNKPYGRLSNLDEEYSAEGDVEVEVWDLNEFFKDPTVLERLAPIEKLIVYGKKETVVDFELANFDRLVHLELYNLLFVNPNILKSFKLRHLVLNCASHLMGQISLADETIGQVPSEVYYSGLADLRTENLQFVALNKRFSVRAFAYLLEKGLLQAIERLYILPADLSSLSHLSDNYPTLKRVDLACEADLLNQLTDGQKLGQLLNELRQDLSIFLGGIPLCAETVERIVDAARRMNVTNGLVLKEEFLLSDEPGCSGFRQLYRQLNHFDNQYIRAVNACGKVKFYLNSIQLTSYDHATLKSISNPRQVSIKCYPDLDYLVYEQIIERLKKYRQITYLAFEIWNYFEFTFLLQFRKLKQLSLRTVYPISQDVILELLVTLEHLEYLDLFFPKPVELDAVQCAEFQNLVDDQLAVSKFESKGLKFEVKIIDFGTPLVRYQLKNEQTMPIDAHIWAAESRKRMLHINRRITL